MTIVILFIGWVRVYVLYCLIAWLYLLMIVEIIWSLYCSHIISFVTCQVYYTVGCYIYCWAHCISLVGGWSTYTTKQPLTRTGYITYSAFDIMLPLWIESHPWPLIWGLSKRFKWSSRLAVAAFVTRLETRVAQHQKEGAWLGCW